VVDKLVREVNSQLAERGVTVRLTAEARDWLARRGYDRAMGARPMARLIQQKIKEPLAEVLLFGDALAPGGEIVADVRGDEIALDYPRA
jgi:ATP-dependent Clp protease ATP-binding subunit ClpA